MKTASKDKRVNGKNPGVQSQVTVRVMSMGPRIFARAKPPSAVGIKRSARGQKINPERVQINHQTKKYEASDPRSTGAKITTNNREKAGSHCLLLVMLVIFSAHDSRSDIFRQA